MDFEFTEDQLGLQANVREVLGSACPTSFIRSMYDEGATAEGLWKQLVDLYWPALGVSEDHGGLGLGFIEVAILAEELGRAIAPGPLFATVTEFAPLLREAGDLVQRERFLSAVASGAIAGTVAFAEDDGSWDVDSVRTSARAVDDGFMLNGIKRHVLDLSSADEIAVVARTEGMAGDNGIGVYIVPRSAVSIHPHGIVDRTLDLGDLVLKEVFVPTDRRLGGGGRRAVERAAEEATVAMALSTIGTCRVIFDMTLQYAKDRVQYGRPIGSFQALKHRLADLFLMVERATSLGYFAAMTIAEDDERRPLASSVAKAAAGDCQRLAAQEGLQLHGGIGYTWEHDLHFFLKRAKAGDGLWGTAAHHRARIAGLLGLMGVGGAGATA